jgi:hypothetical protein
VLDAGRLPADESAAIAEFLEAGGRLVAAGDTAALGIGPAPRMRDADPGIARPLARAPETEGIGAVRTLDGGELTSLGGAEPLLGDGASVLAAAFSRGRGRAIVLADPSPLQNRALASADNAAFALAIAGPGERPVAFLETVHGYGGSTGLAALPASAKWALLGLLLAGTAFAWSRARRIGPVERGEDEELPPPRAAYVDALAGTLERTRRTEEIEELLAARRPLAKLERKVS